MFLLLTFKHVNAGWEIPNVLRVFEAFIQILLNVNLSLNQTPDILALSETNLDDSVDYVNFSVRTVPHPDVFWYRLNSMGAQKSSCNFFHICFT